MGRRKQWGRRPILGRIPLHSWRSCTYTRVCVCAPDGGAPPSRSVPFSRMGSPIIENGDGAPAHTHVCMCAAVQNREHCSRNTPKPRALFSVFAGQRLGTVRPGSHQRSESTVLQTESTVFGNESTDLGTQRSPFREHCSRKVDQCSRFLGSGTARSRMSRDRGAVRMPRLRCSSTALRRARSSARLAAALAAAAAPCRDTVTLPALVAGRLGPGPRGLPAVAVSSP